MRRALTTPTHSFPGAVLRGLAREHGLDAQLVSRRIKNGWTIQKALTTPVKDTRPNGLKAAALARGLKPATVRNRVHAMKMSLQEALTTPLRINERAQMARARGMRPRLVGERLRQGLSLQEALAKPVKQMNKGISQMARKHGMKPGTLQWRLSHGWSMRRALAPVREISQMARKHGMKPRTLRWRLSRGWSMRRALAPVCGRFGRVPACQSG